MWFLLEANIKSDSQVDLRHRLRIRFNKKPRIPSEIRGFSMLAAQSHRT